jgi:spore coat polysaccharide biosynthesis protein SpsF
VIGAFLQVRIDSYRLPAKALLEMAGVPVIGHAMAALRRVNADVPAILTETNSVSALQPLAQEYGFDLYVGDPDDVLARYAEAAAYYGVDTVIRATGDNPLVSPRLGSEILRLHRQASADVSGFDDLPLGTGVEIISRGALERAHRDAVDQYEREHITQHMYRRPKEFRINRIPAPANVRCPDGRVTVDTSEDFHFVRDLVEELYEGRPIEIDQVVSWLTEAPVHHRIRRMA